MTKKIARYDFEIVIGDDVRQEFVFPEAFPLNVFSKVEVILDDENKTSFILTISGQSLFWIIPSSYTLTLRKEPVKYECKFTFLSDETVNTIFVGEIIPFVL